MPLLLFIAAYLFATILRTELPSANSVGNVDDLSAALVFFLTLSALRLVPQRIIRGALIVLLAATTVLYALSNVAYYQFYQLYIDFSFFSMAGDALSGTASISTLGIDQTYLITVAGYAVVAFILGSIAITRITARKLWLFSIPALLALGGLQWVYQVQKPKHFNAKAQHPLMYAVRPSSQGKLIDPSEMAKQLSRFNAATVGLQADARFPLFKAAPTSDTTSHAEPKPSSAKTNVILIVMESVRASETGRWGKTPFSPELDKLASQGFSANNFYANTNQTVRGELAMLCGILDKIDGVPLAKSIGLLQTKCLPEILSEQGINSLWFHGGKKEFYNRDKFLPAIGFTEIYDENRLRESQQFGTLGWGIPDHELLPEVVNILEDSGSEPFFAEIMTLSNHHPFQWPWPEYPNKLLHEDTVSNDAILDGYHSGTHYTDYSIGLFFDALAKSALAKNTYVIVTSDHGIWYFGDEAATTSNHTTLIEWEKYFRAPLLIIGPGIAPGAVSDEVTSQVDIPSTVLDLMNISSDQAFLGSSVFKSQPRLPVYTMYAGKFGMRMENTYCYPETIECGSEYMNCEAVLPDRDTAADCLTTPDDLLHDGTRLKLQPAEQIPQLEFYNDLFWFNQQSLRTGFWPPQRLNGNQP